MCGRRFSNLLPLAPLLASTLTFSACDLAGTLVKAQHDGAAEFSAEHATEFADPENVGPFLRNSLVQGEGELYYAPEYEPMIQGLIFSNIAYGVGWLGEAAGIAEDEGKYEQVEKINRRASLLFARALTLTKRMLRLRDDGFDDALAGGIDVFKAWVDEQFYEKEDASVVLTAGMAYFVSMLKSEDGLAASVDMPYARYMVERSVELDPALDGAQGLAILGTYWCTVPAMVGGNPKYGWDLMQRAMKLTNRGAHGVQVAAAERCAPALQDRKMYHDLLMEVIEAKDVPKYRLPNKLARHQAERMLKKIDDLFYD
ncbi:MAG TPA: TRAP transporter TatT component family protein [Polyangiales bacterium]|jgi:hypothetical protein|nr:TRAP transporter TatT component family protein [Polyangiales bacterium]